MKMPKNIMVYVCEINPDGTPILAVTTALDELLENGERIGEYKLVRESKLTVKRELDPCK